MRIRIGILEGDYVGPEVMAEALKVLRALERRGRFTAEVVPLEVAGAAYDKYGTHLPEHTLKAAADCDVLLKGPFGGPTDQTGHPKWVNLEREAILPLRKEFDLYANLRPVRVLDALADLSPLKREIVVGADVLFVRELVSGIYFGSRPDRMVEGERESADVEAYRESEIRRVAVRAYECARDRRGKVTLVGKSNVLRSSVLWREVVADVARSYPETTSDYMHVDNASMQLILDPKQFDVILTNNIFGDILSDEASALPGSIGLVPSASIGSSSFGLYEPIHGSAPPIAGKNIVNPAAMILCVGLMFRHSFDQPEIARAVEDAVASVLTRGHRTVDLCRQGQPAIGTAEFGNLVVEELARNPQS